MRGILSILALIAFSQASWAHVQLNNPKGGEVFHPGDVITISWEILVNHQQENWDVLFSTNSGTSWDTIAFNLPVSQLEHNWTVPDLATATARIKIVQDNVSGDYKDESNDFTIIHSDTEGAVLTVGQPKITFHYLEPSSSETMDLLLMNTGTGRLEITGLTGVSSPFSLDYPSVPFDIQAGEQLMIQVTFAPEENGSYGQQLTISSSSSSSDVTLQGVSLTPDPANENTCYAVTGVKDGGRLYAIDMTNGTPTLLSNLENIDFSTAVAVDNQGYLLVHDPMHGLLVKVDPLTGKNVLIRKFDLRDVAMDFGVDGNLLLLGTNDAGERHLLSLELGSQELTTIGQVDIRLTGIALNHSTNSLYGVSSDGNLYSIDHINTAPTIIGSSGISNMTDLAFDQEGNLFAIAGGGQSTDNQLLTLNKTNGSVIAEVGNTGLTAVSGLTITGQFVSPLSISGLDQIHIYPNPVYDMLTIDTGRNAPSSISLYSLDGREISNWNSEAVKSKYTLSIRDLGLKSGIYILQMNTSGGLVVEQVIVE